MKYKCKKCGCENLFVKKSGKNTGLYCSECGAFQKWLGKDELRVFEYVESTESKLPLTKSNPQMPSANTPESNFRTCKGTYYNKKTYQKESFDIGYFHGWGTDYDELEVEAGIFTAAIVELPNGHIILVPADRIQFLDPIEN